jgi:uncharacterized protein (DUF305 family)
MDTNKKLIAVAVGAFIVGGLVVMAAGPLINNDQDHHAQDGHGHSSETQSDAKKSGAHMMPDGTMMGGDMGMAGMEMDGMGMTVSSEREFIDGMIPHHQEAIDTAKEVLARGGSTPDIKTLAQNIISAQAQEITDMKTWYKNWYGVDYVDNGMYQPMMRPLANLSGAELDKVFLTDMVKHHMMAIMMAKSVDSHVEHNEIKTLSAAIQTSQSAEITDMQNLLKTLK